MLVDLYKDLNNNDRWYDIYSTTGENSNGKVFYFFNTNYRKLLSFEEGFKVLKNVENIERSSWEHNAHHGQEIEKQHTVNMLKSKLFSKNANVYYRSQKGISFSKIFDADYNDNEKWLITYLTILNGYFNNIPNYIYDRVRKVLNLIEKRGISKQQYIETLQKFIKEYELGSGNIFESDYIFYDTFFKDFEGIDFLNEFIQASESERVLLKEYIVAQRRDREVQRNETDTISYKYKSTGSYTKTTLIDNAKIQYITLSILDNEYKEYEDFIHHLLTIYNGIYLDFDMSKIFSFLDENKNVYKLIYDEVYGKIQYSLNFRNDIETTEDIDVTERIDDTDVYFVDKYNKVSTIIKRLAKANSNYRCELEPLNACTYFTSKESHKNYVEVHHFIPRAVGNDFENSIEIVENYVALCPKCHRLVHLGEDRERLPALNFLLNLRKEKLESKGLKITQKQIKEYYQIEKDS